MLKEIYDPEEILDVRLTWRLGVDTVERSGNEVTFGPVRVWVKRGRVLGRGDGKGVTSKYPPWGGGEGKRPTKLPTSDPRRRKWVDKRVLSSCTPNTLRTPRRRRIHPPCRRLSDTRTSDGGCHLFGHLPPSL